MDTTAEQHLEARVATYLESLEGPGGEIVRDALDYLNDHAGAEAQAYAIDVLENLERLNPDPESAAAALLLPTLGEFRSLPSELEARLPPGLAELLRQFLTLGHFGREYLPADEASSAEGLRRLLLAMVADVRVVLLALAWQLTRMRLTGDGDEGVRRALARETRLIHAPLANRLGIWQFKWELEDLAFSCLEPETHDRIAALVAERRADRQAFVESFMSRLRGVVRDAGITGEVSGRVKHIYSIWRKMQRKGLDFHELFDVRAVRVLVDSVSDCYSVLGHVHTHWRPVPGEFDDYITNPKSNGYQSLHTAVAASRDRVVEVQIRTWEMHKHAELGVAAHWRYKEGGPRDQGFERRVNVMRQLLEAGEDNLDDRSLLENFQNLTAEDRVYALTPRGEVVDMSAGATVLDFAYHIHTEVGHRCRGARINGRIVPLTTQVSNGDRVEILTGKESRPSRDWLSPHLGYVQSGRARAKIRHWFREMNRDENLDAGEQLVQTELERLGLPGDAVAGTLGRFNLKRLEDLYVAVGNGDLTAAQVGQAVARELGELQRQPVLVRRRAQDQRPAPADEISIEGVGNLMYQMARCCQPLPGDHITGFVTRSRGVSIHREDCREFQNLARQHPERILNVRWGDAPAREYPARLDVAAWDRKELIKDIGAALAAEGVSVSGMEASHSDTGEAHLSLTVRITDYEQLSSLLARINGLQGILHARRVRETDESG